MHFLALYADSAWMSLCNYIALSILRGSSEDADFDADAMLEQLRAVQQKAILSPEGVTESTGTKGPALKMASSIFTPSPKLVSSSGKYVIFPQ